MTAVFDRYQQLVAAGEVKPDAEQRRAIDALDRLARQLAEAEQPRLWARLTGKAPPAPGGVYMWGGVGRGKTMLLAIAYDAIAGVPKRRVHFHEFMLEVHERLRAERAKEEGDPIPAVAEAIAGEARLLAFDEMIVNNSADAMILSRLFTQLLEQGVTVITTSNRQPHELYQDGLNRDLFLPFIHLIERKMEVVSVNGPTDYRRERLGDFPTWYVPNGPEATEALAAAFFRMTDYPPEDRKNVPTEDIILPGGRILHVPK
jgi:cell division protein ZapE